jgi:molybdenum cofactor cytidylyltransferase
MPTQAESPVACLLLAAGSSRRMGQDKLSLPFGAGSTVLAHTAEALSRAPCLQHVMVTRAEPLFDAEALGFDVFAIGKEADAGMHRSLKLGLSRLDPSIEAVMVCLGDQPFLRTNDYSLLLQTFYGSLSEGLDLLYPAGPNGERGNPAIIHRSYFPEIMEEPDTDRGCRYLFDRYPERVRAWQPPTPAFFQDLDTPADYRACLN